MTTQEWLKSKPFKYFSISLICALFIATVAVISIKRLEKDVYIGVVFEEINKREKSCSLIGVVGDGICDLEANVIECNFDMGDCCEMNNDCIYGDSTTTEMEQSTTTEKPCFFYNIESESEPLEYAPHYDHSYHGPSSRGNIPDEFTCQTFCQNAKSICNAFTYYGANYSISSLRKTCKLKLSLNPSRPAKNAVTGLPCT